VCANNSGFARIQSGKFVGNAVDREEEPWPRISST
jgi:hypothetical protein